MAKTYTNTATSPLRVGLVRDVDEAIVNKDNHKTKFLTTIGKGKKAKATKTEWQREDTEVYDVNRAAEQGKKADPSATNAPEMLANEQHIFEDSKSESYTGEKVDEYGISKKLNRQVLRAMTGLKEQMNKRALGNYGGQEAAAGNNNTGKFAGYLAFATGDQALRGAGGADGGYNPSTKVVDAGSAGTARALTETLFKDAVQAIGKDREDTTYDAFVGATQKRIISDTFTGMVALQQNVNEKSQSVGLIASVGFYRTDQGLVRIHYDHLAPDDAMPIVDKSLLEMRYLWNWKTENLAKVGLSHERQISCSTTLCNKEPNAHGAIFDLA